MKRALSMAFTLAAVRPYCVAAMAFHTLLTSQRTVALHALLAS